MRPPFVYVIVPAYDEAPRILAVLAALRAQSYPPDRFEILVVDNGSRDATPQLVAEAAAADARITLLVETATRGPDAARNRALRVARGEVLAFTDADCRPDARWLEAGVAALAQGAALAAGRVAFTFGSRPGIAELYDSLNFLQHDVSVARRRIAFTANLFVRREVFQSLGSFDVVAGWNGDAWLTRRATDAGFRLDYAPAAVVAHPARPLGELLRKVVRIGKGQARHGATAGGKGPRPSLVSLLRSKPHFHHLLPQALARRVSREGLQLGAAEFARLWLFGWVVVGVGAAATLAGTISARRRPLTR